MTSPKPITAFIIMPFDQAFVPVRNAIQTAVKKGTRGQAIRADDIFKHGEVIDHVKTAIETSDFCIADTTGNNPNVMWEVGFARALKKPVVVIRQDTRDIPFDVRAERVFTYDGKNLRAFQGNLIRVVSSVVDELQRTPPSLAWRYDELSHLRHVLDRCRPTPTADSLLQLLLTAVGKAHVKKWQLGDEVKLLKALQKICTPPIHQNAFWWLIVHGVLEYDQIDCFQDENDGVQTNLELVSLSARGIALLQWITDTQ